MKTALITGASEGIGRVFAQKLASEGYSITAAARNEQRLMDLISELPSNDHSFISADLSTAKGIESISEELQKNHFDLLVNNAGFGVYGTFAETSLTKLQEMTRLNCDALVALSHAFLNNAQKGDALVNVASVLAYLPMPYHALYAATKSFVKSLSDSLWYEQKEKGIYVMALCPGYTKTQFNLRAGGNDSEIPDYYSQTPKEVVETALHALKQRKKPFVITGTKNKAMVKMGSLLPEKTMMSIAAKMTAQYFNK